MIPALLTALVAAAGCGGTETTDHGTFVDPASAEAKGGASKTTSTPATLTATPSVVDRNAPLTLGLYPGAYAGQQLLIKWQCYQNGQMLAYDGSNELTASVAMAVPGYTADGANLDWTLVVSQSSTIYALVAGVGADCQAQAYSVNKRFQWTEIASTTFSVSP